MTRRADESNFFSWLTPTIVPYVSNVCHFVTKGIALEWRTGRLVLWRTGRVPLTAENIGTAGRIASTRIVAPEVPAW